MRALFTSALLLLAGTALADCVFCNREILHKQTVLESRFFIVLPALEPRVYGHLLAIPKRHMMKAHEMTEEEWEDLGHILPKVAVFFANCLGTDEYIILEKNGPNAFQQIPHVHFHLLPVHSQKWSEIFDIIPERLSLEEIDNTTNLFKKYFRHDWELQLR